MRTWLVVALLVLTGCAASLRESTHVPTLLVTNLTDNQISVVWAHHTLGRLAPMASTCVKLLGLTPSTVELAFRPLAHPALIAAPTDYSRAEGWALTLTSASASGGFFAYPAERCK